MTKQIESNLVAWHGDRVDVDHTVVNLLFCVVVVDNVVVAICYVIVIEISRIIESKRIA